MRAKYTVYNCVAPYRASGIDYQKPIKIYQLSKLQLHVKLSRSYDVLFKNASEVRFQYGNLTRTI